MSTKPRACIFCGATSLSKEHIWSEWTYKILPKQPGMTHVRGVIQSSKFSPTIKGIRSRKAYQGDVSSIRIRAVCRSKNRGTNSLGATGCNNGWMNHLEDAAKGIITPLVLDHPTTLDREQQRVLSTWIATKLIVAEFSEPEDAVSTPAERRYVMEHQTAPLTWKIRIARQDGKQWRTGYGRHSVTLGTLDETGTPVPPDGCYSKNTKIATLGLGHLVVHAFSSRVPEMFNVFNYSSTVLHPIHPFVDRLSWPPQPILAGPGIDFLMSNFERWTGGLKWRAAPEVRE